MWMVLVVLMAAVIVAVSLPLAVYVVGLAWIGWSELRIESITVSLYYGLLMTILAWWACGRSAFSSVLPLFVVTLFPLVGLLLAGGFAVSIRRLGRLQHAGRCASCGYDLFGNVSGICPECGTRFI